MDAAALVGIEHGHFGQQDFGQQRVEQSLGLLQPLDPGAKRVWCAHFFGKSPRDRVSLLLYGLMCLANRRKEHAVRLA